MKSYIAKPSDIDRKWYVIDAEGKTLGKLAVEAAMILRGKKKPTQRRLLSAARRKPIRSTRDTAVIRADSKRLHSER